MAAVTVQELSQSRNLLNSIAEQKASVTLSFPSVLKNGTSWMLKSEIYQSLQIQKIALNLSLHKPIDIKLLNRLRLNFSQLNENKFRHNFRDTVNPFCLCNAETETTNQTLALHLVF